MRLAGLVDTRPLTEYPTFRRLWIGTTASGFGSGIGAFAVTFYIWDRTHNAAAVGLIGLFTAAPLIAFALIGSAFADQVDRRRLALVVTWGRLGTSLGMAAVALSSSDQVGAMLVLAAISSGLSAVGEPARRAFIPRLLPGDRLAAGLALNHLSVQLAMLLGPVLAGVLTAGWGTGVCFLVNAVTFAAALFGLAGLPAAPPTVPAAARTGGTAHADGADGTDGRASGAGRAGASAVWAGLRFTAVTPAVRGAFLADLSATVLAMPVALFPVINQEKFGGSPQVLGLFTTALAVGGVLASALSGLATRRRRPGLVLLICGTVWGASLAAAGISSQLPLVLALLALAGGADTWAVVSRGTVVQASTPDSHRGRVASLEYIVGSAGPQLGSLRAGLIAAGTSGSAALVIGALSCLFGTGLIAALSPRLRQFAVTDTTQPAPVGDPHGSEPGQLSGFTAT